MDDFAVSFGDLGDATNTTTGIGVKPIAEFGNLRLLPDINILSQLRRGTQGTGAYAVHPTRTDVVDGGTNQILPTTSPGNLIAYANVLLNAGSLTAVDGLGLEGSITPAAIFIKGMPANTLPGIRTAITSEDAINTLTTELNKDIYTEG
jgi:hypothetical protein